jgi:2-polyprenyl-3-methyl-5-hydroxy-6-metoxy-1,4-benzoquinol methylase
MSEMGKESHRIWEELGPWWDASVEEGDLFHRTFLFPSIERLLEIRGREVVLDAGCGNGALSRRLAKMNAEVFGVDFSSTLLKQAKARDQNSGIEYSQVDLTDIVQLKKLAEKRQFDRVVCSMVLHDMPTVIPLIESLHFLLKPKGSFIFSIPHPCFNSPYVLFEPPGGITIEGYSIQTASKMRSKPGQPIEQLVFHRPMNEYFHLLFAQKMVMNGFEEPCVNPDVLPDGYLWGERSEIPPALISRWIFQD